MKIHLVSEHANPLALVGGVDAGGQNVHVAALAGALADQGADVVVHTRRDDPAVPRTVQLRPGVIVDHVDAGPPQPLAKDDLLPFMGDFARDLEESWRNDPPDVVHAHFWMSGIASLDAADQVGVPVALTFHALGAEKRQFQGITDTSPAVRLEEERRLAQRVDRVIATTSEECRSLVRMGADPSRVSVVPCGVDVSTFRPDGDVWPARGRRPRVVTLSRLVPRKGLADVIEAVASLDDVELLIAGGPPEAMLGDDAYAVQLQRFIDVTGTSDRIRLLGSIERERAASLIRSADVVVCAPWYEPFGLVAVEAMACGVPVIASAVGGLLETVVDDVTGMVVPPRRPISIRSAIRTMIDHPARRTVMGRAAVRRARHYEWPTIAGRTMDIYRQLARDGRSTRNGAEPAGATRIGDAG